MSAYELHEHAAEKIEDDSIVTHEIDGAAELLLYLGRIIRAATYLITLASVGTLSVPLTADAAGDATAGEKIIAHCAPCHSTKPTKNKVGPSLAGVFGRKSGTEPGYTYSSALKGQNVTLG